MFCRKCGKQVQEGHKFCTYCGTKIEPIKPAQTPAAPTQAVKAQAEPTQSAKAQAEPVQAAKAQVAKAQATPTQAAPKKPVKGVAPKMEIPQAKPARAKAPNGPELPPIPQVTVNNNKKKMWPLITAAIIGLAAVAGVGGYFTWQHFAESNDDDDKGESVKKNRDSNTEDGTEKETESKEISVSKDRQLLEEKLDEIVEEKGYIAGKSYDMIANQGSASFDESGVLGSYIADVSGDDVDDLIVVYASKDLWYLYADAYTVEDDEVKIVAEERRLNGSNFWDNGNVSIYIKETTTGYNLVCDSYLVGGHYADGMTTELYSYACDDNKYTSVTSYSISGSALEETDVNNAKIMAQKAGLKNVTTAFENMFVAQDSDVTFIAGYTINAEDNLDYSHFYEVNNFKYGKVDVYELTKNGDMLEGEGEKFLTDASQRTFSSSIYSEDYILPMSAERLLTDADVAGIINDEQKLRLATNEIYARHGRKFDTEFIQQYFDSKSWYTGLYDPVTFDNTIQMSDIENKNAEYLRGLYNSRYANGQ